MTAPWVEPTEDEIVRACKITGFDPYAASWVSEDATYFGEVIRRTVAALFLVRSGFRGVGIETQPACGAPASRHTNPTRVRAAPPSHAPKTLLSQRFSQPSPRRSCEARMDG